MPVEFPAYADRTIQLMIASNGQLGDEEVLQFFASEGILDSVATELLLFLPTAFCRHMLPQGAWPIYYVEYISEKEQPQILYSENLR